VNFSVSPAGVVVLRYHARTLRLLGITPRIAPTAVKEFDRVERRTGRTLPASVREWYSLKGACQLLRKYSNADPPLAISELGKPRTDTNGGGPHDLLARDLLVFRYENQAVCVWAVRLDGSDDPPVVVDYDSQFQTWLSCGATFSGHLFAWMWDYALVLGQDLLIQAHNRPLSAQALAFLGRHFDVGPETHGWPGHTQYRFSKEDQRILIWASDDQADWLLSADVGESLRQLVRTVWDCDQVGKWLWSHTEQGESLLKQANRPA
jgi:hypothetical protein